MPELSSHPKDHLLLRILTILGIVSCLPFLFTLLLGSFLVFTGFFIVGIICIFLMMIMVFEIWFLVNAVRKMAHSEPLSGSVAAYVGVAILGLVAALVLWQTKNFEMSELIWIISFWGGVVSLGAVIFYSYKNAGKSMDFDPVPAEVVETTQQINPSIDVMSKLEKPTIPQGSNQPSAPQSSANPSDTPKPQS